MSSEDIPSPPAVRPDPPDAFLDACESFAGTALPIANVLPELLPLERTIYEEVVQAYRLHVGGFRGLPLDRHSILIEEIEALAFVLRPLRDRAMEIVRSREPENRAGA